VANAAAPLSEGETMKLDVVEAGDTLVESETCTDTTSVASSDDFEARPSDIGEHRGSDRAQRRFGVRHVLGGLLVLAIAVCGGGVGHLWWQKVQHSAADRARAESTQTAKDATNALLSYEPGTAEEKLTAARDRLTGSFRDSYTSLTKDVVIPAAVQRQVSAVADVPAVAVLTAGPRHAVAMVFVDQTTIIGGEAPTATSSVVKVTLDRVDGRWLVSGFDPM
jgi:Mce-associated membrane protein